MPYNVTDTGPAQYALQQQQMGQEQTQNLIKMLLMLKQARTAQDQWQSEQSLREQEAAQRAQQFGQDLGFRKQEAASHAPLEAAQANYYNAGAGYRTERGNAMAPPNPTKMTPEFAQFLSKMGVADPAAVDPNYLSALEKVHIKQMEDKNSANAKAQNSTTGGRPAAQPRPQEWSDPAANQRHDLSTIAEALNKRKIFLNTAYNKETDSKVRENLDWRRRNVDLAVRKITGLLPILKPGKPLPDEEWTKVTRIAGGLDRTETEPEFWTRPDEADLQPTAGMKKIVANPWPGDKKVAQPNVPPEVADYMKKHPEVSPEAALNLYMKWKKNG